MKSLQKTSVSLTSGEQPKTKEPFKKLLLLLVIACAAGRKEQGRTMVCGPAP